MISNLPTLNQARKVLQVVDAGLCSGKGQPIPGEMCVEAAVCFALGEPHGDNPKCVHPLVRSFKIALNDKTWSSNAGRARGMRRIAIAQLGTDNDNFDSKLFLKKLTEETIRKIVPLGMRQLLKIQSFKKYFTEIAAAAKLCEEKGDRASAVVASNLATRLKCAAYAYAYAGDIIAAGTAPALSDAATSAADAAIYAPQSGNAAEAANAASNAGIHAFSDPANFNQQKLFRDSVFTLSAECGVSALRAAGAHGIKLLDKLLPT